MTYQVGFIGLGRMGFHMAGHINRVDVCGVWNRTSSVAEKHVATHGSIFVNSIESFRCPIVFCCLPTSAEVRQAAEKLVQARKNHLKKIESSSSSASVSQAVSLLVDCTSGDYNDTVDIGAYLKEHGISMVDCPVSGGPRGAEAGSLTAMLGGEDSDISLVKKYCTFAKKTDHVGPLGSGHAVKSVNNILNTANLITITEGLLALKKIGICPSKAVASINASSGRSLQSEVRIPEEVLSGRFGYGFDFNLMLKDVRIAGNLLEARNKELYDMGVLRHVVENMNKAGETVKELGEDQDYTYISRYFEKNAGTDLRVPSSEAGGAVAGGGDQKGTAVANGSGPGVNKASNNS